MDQEEQTNQTDWKDIPWVYANDKHAVRSMVDILKRHSDTLGWYWLYTNPLHSRSTESINHGDEFRSIVEMRVPKEPQGILQEIKSATREGLGYGNIRMVIWESGLIKIDVFYKKLRSIKAVERLSMHDAIEGGGGNRYLEFIVSPNDKSSYDIFLKEINKL